VFNKLQNNQEFSVCMSNKFRACAQTIAGSEVLCRTSILYYHERML
jgi:uncharacterized membrane protein